MARKLALPARGHLPTTGPVDWIDRYYAPGIGTVLRQRLRWAQKMLPPRTLDRVLEIGYGSGVFQYALKPHARVSVGIDVHEAAATVRQRLALDDIESHLLRATGEDLPFRDDSFDFVVIVSALEFVPVAARCLRECRRVLRPGGRFVCLTPRRLEWADAIFRRLTGQDPEAEFSGGRDRAQEALAREMPEAVRLGRPAWLPLALAPYEVVVLDKPSRAASTPAAHSDTRH